MIGTSPEYQRFLAAMRPPTRPRESIVRAHYHVGYNMPGYLPEMDPYVVASKRAAISAVADEARRLNDWCGVDGHGHGAYRRSGGYGDVWLAPRDCAGSGAEFHVWMDGPCMCAEGNHMIDCDRDVHNADCRLQN